MLAKKRLVLGLVLVSGLLLMAGYNRPYRWWPVNDLSEQAYIKAFTPDSGRAPAEGSVGLNDFDHAPLAMDVMSNAGDAPDFARPEGNVSSAESIKRGQDLFTIYCYPCHGQEMSVDPAKFSPIKKGTAEGKYALLAPGMERVALDPYTDEMIYATISNGSVSGLMKRMNYHLSPQERWDVVDYVRSLVDTYKQTQR